MTRFVPNKKQVQEGPKIQYVVRNIRKVMFSLNVSTKVMTDIDIPNELNVR